MTKAKVDYILNILGYQDEADASETGYVPMFKNFMTVLTKDSCLYTDISRFRYKYNSYKQLIERITVRIFSFSPDDVPKHGNYDDYGDSKHDHVIYEYVSDKDGNVLVDYFDYNAIVMFIPNAAAVKTTDVIGG